MLANKICKKCGEKYQVTGELLSLIRRKFCDKCGNLRGIINGRKYRATHKLLINQKRKESYAKNRFKLLGLF